MKEKIINYIEALEAKSLQVDDYFKQRNELYIENQNKDKEIERLNKTNNEIFEANATLAEEIEKLQNQLQQKENIIKEVREYIEKHIKYECDAAFNGKQFYSYHLYDFDKKEILEILDKEVN